MLGWWVTESEQASPVLITCTAGRLGSSATVTGINIAAMLRKHVKTELHFFLTSTANAARHSIKFKLGPQARCKPCLFFRRGMAKHTLPKQSVMLDSFQLAATVSCSMCRFYLTRQVAKKLIVQNMITQKYDSCVWLGLVGQGG